MARAKKKSTGYKIRVTDGRYTGEEPVWDGWEKWPVEKFEKERSRAFNFYNYYLEAKDSKHGVLEWMEKNSYSKAEISAVKAAPDYLPGPTTGTLCISLLRGMPEKHPDLDYRSDKEFVVERIADAIKTGRTLNQEEAVEQLFKTEPVSPMVLLANKTTRTAIMDLDALLDDWIRTRDQKVRRIDLYETMKGHDLSALACPQVERWLTKLLDGYVAARDKTDPDYVEGYSYLSASEIRDRIDALEDMLKDLNRYALAAKATRAPRKKRAKSADKQITKLQFCKEDAEYKIASINTTRIVGAYRLLAFNTKKRVLLDFYAQNAEGFAIKGTSLKNVDELTSRCTRLRKPQEFLEIVLNNTPKQIEKAWGNLTTKENKPKSRINSDVVLLRVFERKD